MKNNWILLILSGFLVFATTACKKTFINPNNPDESQIFNNVAGMEGVILGIKNVYTVGTSGSPGVNTSALYGAISMDALLTSEFRLLSSSNVALAQFDAGGSGISTDNQLLLYTWAACNQVNSQCLELLGNVQKVTDPATQNALIIYAKVYRGIALGTMATFWQQAPLTTGARVGFSSRDSVLAEAIRQLDDAYTLAASTSIPAAFKINVLGNYEDMLNISAALSARYNLFRKNYSAAIAKAAQVSLSSKSYWVFDSPNPNPVFNTGLNGGNTMGKPITTFGLPDSLKPETGDQRIPFYQTANAAGGFSFYTAGTTQVPYYVPGEMLLTIAEAYLMQGNTDSAVAYINKVRTKTAGQDVFGIGASLPAYSGITTITALMTEIYRQRCYELYSLGLKLEDSRRLNRTAPGASGAERKRNYLPYPLQERNGNTNTPADPSI